MLFDFLILVCAVVLAYALGHSDGRLAEHEDNEFKRMDKVDSKRMERLFSYQKGGNEEVDMSLQNQEIMLAQAIEIRDNNKEILKNLNEINSLLDKK